MVFNAVGGGTGSGLGALLVESLSVDYGRKSKLGFTTIYLLLRSLPLSSSLTTPCSPPTLSSSTPTVMLDNEVIDDIC